MNASLETKETPSPSDGKDLKAALLSTCLFWVARHFAGGMVLYFVANQIPGLMVKTNLWSCVALSVMLWISWILFVSACSFLLVTGMCGFAMLKNPEAFYSDQEVFPKLGIPKKPLARALCMLGGLLLNMVIFKVFCSYFPFFISVDGWLPAFLTVLLLFICSKLIDIPFWFAIKNYVTSSKKLSADKTET